MMRATLDLLGIYKYHPTLFNEFVIPEALDKTVLTDNLLMESAEMEILYPDADFLEKAIGAWSSKMITVWNELYDTTQYVYNPIWNKDGTVKETITRDLAATEDVTTNTDRTDNLTDKNTRNFEDKETRNTEDKETRNLAGSNTDNVFGFNSSSAAPAASSNSTDTGTDTVNHTGSDTFNHTGTDTVDHTGTQDVDVTVDRDTTDTGTITTERTEQGNIGLTSTQDLILAQRQVVQLNLYDTIIKDFIARFCLAVY